MTGNSGGGSSLPIKSKTGSGLNSSTKKIKVKSSKKRKEGEISPSRTRKGVIEEIDEEEYSQSGASDERVSITIDNADIRDGSKERSTSIEQQKHDEVTW